MRELVPDRLTPLQTAIKIIEQGNSYTGRVIETSATKRLIEETWNGQADPYGKTLSRDALTTSLVELKTKAPLQELTEAIAEGNALKGTMNKLSSESAKLLAQYYFIFRSLDQLKSRCTDDHIDKSPFDIAQEAIKQNTPVTVKGHNTKKPLVGIRRTRITQKDTHIPPLEALREIVSID